jgi:hypothetical protein
MVGLGRVELPTSRLSGVRSSQLSYRPTGKSLHVYRPFVPVLALRKSKNRWGRSFQSWVTKSGSQDPKLFRKEVIQPQVLLRLPCYDFTPITDPTFGACPPCGLAQRLLVKPTFVV